MTTNVGFDMTPHVGITRATNAGIRMPTNVGITMSKNLGHWATCAQWAQVTHGRNTTECSRIIGKTEI